MTLQSSSLRSFLGTPQETLQEIFPSLNGEAARLVGVLANASRRKHVAATSQVDLRWPNDSTPLTDFVGLEAHRSSYRQQELLVAFVNVGVDQGVAARISADLAGRSPKVTQFRISVASGDVVVAVET